MKRPQIDLFLESEDGTEYYFDLKTAKPNVDEIIGLKRKMLEWVAIRGAINPQPKIYTGLAIPYNPYEPQPYDRWTFQGMFDLPNEIKVAEEFWDFLGGKNTYEELLQILEDVSMELRPEIDAKFAAFAPKRQATKYRSISLLGKRLSAEKPRCIAKCIKQTVFWKPVPEHCCFLKTCVRASGC